MSRYTLPVARISSRPVVCTLPWTLPPTTTFRAVTLPLMRPCSPTARSPSVLTSPVISPSKRMLVLECRRPSSLISLLSTVSADTGTDLRLGLGSNTDGPPVGCDTVVTVPTQKTAAPADSCRFLADEEGPDDQQREHGSGRDGDSPQIGAEVRDAFQRNRGILLGERDRRRAASPPSARGWAQSGCLAGGERTGNGTGDATGRPGHGPTWAALRFALMRSLVLPCHGQLPSLLTRGKTLDTAHMLWYKSRLGTTFSVVPKPRANKGQISAAVHAVAAAQPLLIWPLFRPSPSVHSAVAYLCRSSQAAADRSAGVRDPRSTRIPRADSIPAVTAWPTSRGVKRPA